MCDLLGGVAFYSNSYVFYIWKVTYLECLVLELLLSDEKMFEECVLKTLNPLSYVNNPHHDGGNRKIH